MLHREEIHTVIADDNQDEYDGYWVQIVHMLDAGATVDEWVEHMRWIVTDGMEIGFDEPHGRNCAEELVNYWRSHR